MREWLDADKSYTVNEQVRPPVQHTFGVALESQQAGAAKVEVFRHRLLQHFMLSVFCKLPVQTITTLADLRYAAHTSPRLDFVPSVHRF